MVFSRCLALMPQPAVGLTRRVHFTNVDGLALDSIRLTPKVALMDGGPGQGMHPANLRGRRSLRERLEEAPTRGTVVAAHESEAVLFDVATIDAVVLDPRCLYIREILTRLLVSRVFYARSTLPLH